MFLLNSKIKYQSFNSCLSKHDWLSCFSILTLCLFVAPISIFYLIPGIYNTQNISISVFSFELNSLSVVFSFLTIFIFYIGILANWDLLANRLSIKLCSGLLLFLLSNLAAFCSATILTFYFFFELTSLPILYFIIEFGKRKRRTKATQLFLSFTLLGSVCLFFSIFLDCFIINANPVLSLCFLTLAFFIKLPIFPFYIWLPEAHVESPTIGSIFLAGISLKLGGFGIYKFLLPLVEKSKYTDNLSTLICVAVLCSIIFSSIGALVVHDFKKIIAYSSISHMGLFTFNLFLINSSAKIGSILGMAAHSLTAASLFFIAGIVYEKIKSRNTLYLSGLVMFMPLCSAFLLLNVLANISFPGSLAFVSEIVIYSGIGNLSIFILIIYSLLSLLVAAFSFKLLKLFYFGNISSYSRFKIKDLNRRETILLLFLLTPQYFLGLFPNYVLELIINF